MTELPPLPVLAALLQIDLDDPADADDIAALADLLSAGSCARYGTTYHRPHQACTRERLPLTVDGGREHEAEKGLLALDSYWVCACSRMILRACRRVTHRSTGSRRGSSSRGHTPAG